MRQAVLREVVRVDVNRQLHIDIPVEMGDEFEIIVLPIQTQVETSLRQDEKFALSVYSEAVETDAKEDAIWEQYVSK
jgi:hypothetical protein